MTLAFYLNLLAYNSLKVLCLASASCRAPFCCFFSNFELIVDLLSVSEYFWFFILFRQKNNNFGFGACSLGDKIKMFLNLILIDFLKNILSSVSIRVGFQKGQTYFRIETESRENIYTLILEV